ncbi:MAG TPA: hypothetical protein PLH25_09780 [Flavobacterium sp.]|nr:hypothetical protein [Flavobacterium sp.]
MKNKLNLAVALVLCSIFSFAQTSSKSFTWNKKPSKDNVIMTWNKTTPEQEMKDDIKALAEYGVTIKYSNVKRNEKREITAIDVSFEDKNGGKGTLSYKNNKPISTIKFFKQGEEIGFGEPSSNSIEDILAFSDLPSDKFKQFNFNFDTDSLSTDSFEFKTPNGNPFITTKKKFIYQKDGKKPLVITDGEVVEGGEDYTQEEIAKIKEDLSSKEDEDEISIFSDFNFNDKKDLSKQMEKMQEQINKLLEKNGLNEEKEPQQTKKEVEKTKTTLKVKKA